MKHPIIFLLIFCVIGIHCGLQAQLPSFQEISTACGITDVADITDLFGNGAAAADFDNDGDIDFYLTTDENIPDRLYQNDGQGHFTDIAAEAGILEIGSNRAALWFDFNGDHRLDLVVAGENCVGLSCAQPIHLALYQQTEDSKFIEVSAATGLDIGSSYDHIPFYGIGGLAAADMNQDGYLDLILTVWGGGIKLFENNGGETFTDITAQAGLIMIKKTPWQAMIHDFNEDGLMDIYCNVDFSTNKLWINKGGVFEDQAEAYGLNNAFNEMGMTMGDYDNDGDLDIYITNITRDFQGTPQYNVFYEQQRVGGKVRFREFARDLGVSQSGWDWGTTFIEINNDGRLDLIATNGWWDKLAYGDDRSNMWLNTTAGFVNISEQCGFNDNYAATTLVAFDLDRDGDLDILQTLKDNETTNKPLMIYENLLEELSKPGNYLTIKPRMNGTNHYAIGGVVTIVANELISARLISAGNSFYGQEPAEAFFGLGNRTAIKEVKVKWPTNEVSFYKNIPINQAITLNYDFVQAPSDLTAIYTDDKAELSWRDNATNETGFVLHRSEDSTFTDYREIVLEENEMSYEDSEVTDAQKHYYRVRAFNTNVQSDNSNIADIGFGSDNQNDERVLIYPNPLRNNDLSIKCNVPYIGLVNVLLYDLSGKLIWSAEAFKSDTLETFEYPVQVPQGIYLLVLKMGDYEEQHKLVVTNN